MQVAIVGAITILEALQCDRGGCDCHGAARRGRGDTHCPVHDDPKPSLSVTEKGGKPLFHCQAGCEQAIVLEALRSRGLWSVNGAGPKAPGRTIVATYDYVNADGWLLYQAVRYRPKDFRQRRPDPERAGQWIWELHSVRDRMVLYRLPELLAAQPGRTVFCCEGEKDVDRLAALGLLATTNAMGAGKWREQYTETLRGRSVVLLPDNDAAGRKHVSKVAGELLGAGCTVRLVELPGLPDGGDVSDWLDAGHAVEELKALVAATEPMTAPAKVESPAPFRLQVEDSDPPVWLVHFPRGPVRVSNSDLFIWTRVRDAYLAELKAGPGWAPQSTREWNEHVAELLAAMDQDPEGHVPVPPARTWHGRVALLLQEMARYHGTMTRIDVDAEKVYFRFSELVRRNSEDTHNQRGIDKERMLRQHLHVGVERLGGFVATGREESWVPLKSLELDEP